VKSDCPRCENDGLTEYSHNARFEIDYIAFLCERKDFCYDPRRRGAMDKDPAAGLPPPQTSVTVNL